ncbi:MAG: F0F1 ATP synthase subunit epsilon [Candidatus Eisenbacteria bacterium]|nr:F0F1 ATP synthase subunit epsilon [Candidatus Eisenbacteria bacterium]
MAETFHLSLLTPERSVLEAPVESIIVPGEDGYLGVLAHHAPLIAALAPGKLTVRRADGTTSIWALSGGFLEVSENQATVLADALEEPSKIDVERAQRAADRARERLRDTTGAFDIERAGLAWARALNRLKLAGPA